MSQFTALGLLYNTVGTLSTSVSNLSTPKNTVSLLTDSTVFHTAIGALYLTTADPGLVYVYTPTDSVFTTFANTTTAAGILSYAVQNNSSTPSVFVFGGTGSETTMTLGSLEGATLFHTGATWTMINGLFPNGSIV